MLRYNRGIPRVIYKGKFWGDKQLIIKEMKQCGLLNGQLEERFNGQLVLPLFDHNNQCVKLFTRKVPELIKSTHIRMMVS